VYLQILWKKELDAFTMEVMKSKDKNMKALIKPLAKIDHSLVQTLLKSWIYRCKVIHSLAFFQWRYEFVDTAKKNEIVLIFEDKLQFLRDRAHGVSKKGMSSIEPSEMKPVEKNEEAGENKDDKTVADEDTDENGSVE